MTSLTENKSLGIVVPVYRSTKSVKLLLKQLASTFDGILTYHVYLINDSGRRDIYLYLKLCCAGPNVTLVSFDRNYGQQPAVLCGLRLAKDHTWVVTMDDDLEHPVRLIPLLLEKLNEGFDLVYAIPRNPCKSPLRQLGSRLRDRLFPAPVSSFRIMTGKTAKRAAACQCRFFYFSAVVFTKQKNRPPLKAAHVFYKKSTRPYGRSGYNIKKLVLLYGKLVLYYSPLSFLTELFVKKICKKENTPLYQIKERPPRLMILGGSNCQLHAFWRARERSIDTVLADYTKNPPAKEVAMAHVPVSTFDARGCIEAGRQFGIDGIMTLGTDQPVLTAALAADALCIPSFLSISQARSVTNKMIMKKRLSAAGIKTAPYVFLSKKGDFFDWKGEACNFTLKPPFVLKPLDSQGQRGIFKVDTKEELFSHLLETLSFSRESCALVEEFYESDEITVSGWIHQGQLTLLTITDRLLYPDSTHIGVCIGHRFPSVHMNRYEEIRRLCEQLVSVFSLNGGPFYLQLLIGAEGIFVNELACRIGGAFEDVTIPYLTGFSILDAVIDGALGCSQVPQLPEDFRCDRLDKASAVLLLFCRPGRLHSLTSRDTLLKLPYLLDCGFNYEAGCEIPPVENATARFGHAVITGTKTSIFQNIRDFYDHLEVLDEKGSCMLQKFDFEEDFHQ